MSRRRHRQSSQADAFISGDPNKTDAAAFRSEGLRAAAISHPTVPGADGAIRLVLVFPDARTAQADAQRNVRSAPPGSTAKTFSVPGIPGGQGNELDTPDGHIGGMNDFFTVGAYEYIVGVAPTAGAASAPSRDAMNAVVVAWYHQVAALT